MKPHGAIHMSPVAGCIALACGASAWLGWAIAQGWYVLTPLLAVLAGWAVYRLVRHYGDSIRRVTFMFDAIDNDDYNFRFREEKQRGRSTDDALLNSTLNRIRETLMHAKRRAEERERYYELIMECARTGLLTLDDAGSVYQINGEALRIFALQRMTHIRQLNASAPGVFRTLASIRPGEKHHVTEAIETGELNLTLSCSAVTLDRRPLRVVAVSDIDSELNEKEIESWSRLTRILTHEIMNSLAPITSLSDTLLRHGGTTDARLASGLETISATGRRLMAFVESFRRFTRIPEPGREAFEVGRAVERAVAMIDLRGVELKIDIDPADTMIYADPTLVGQVVVNLLKNAREAVGAQSDKRIEIASRIDAQERVVIEISNNGGAIPQEVADNVFTPFFTTKADGSGIGLSVSRRIMQLHGGSLRLTANSDRRVTFTLVFG